MLLDDLTAQERAIIVTIELLRTGRISNCRVRELTGLCRQAATVLIADRVSRWIPIVYNTSNKTWEFAQDTWAMP